MASKQAKIELAVIQLNHICNLRGAEGIPGDVIAVPPKVAELLIARGGAKAVSSPNKSPSPKGDET